MSHPTIRFATIDDTDAIMDFIGRHWKHGHVLSVNKPFFLYEYASGNDLNFALAVDGEANEIVGLCGFIKNSKERKGSDIWGSLWKVLKTDHPMLGINILEFVHQQTGCRVFSSCGIAKKTIPIYDYLRFHTGKLTHYYRLNDKKEYKIAQIKNKVIGDFNRDKNLAFDFLPDFAALERTIAPRPKAKMPYKDNWYLEKRYFNHPVYRYKALGIAGETVLFAREIIQDQTKILRIIDCIGNFENLRRIGQALQNLIVENDYEYVDLLCGGIAPDMLTDAGFLPRNGSDENIIPNYFEPFVPENTDIYFFTSAADAIPIFKGDGDQDRPAFIP